MGLAMEGETASGSWWRSCGVGLAVGQFLSCVDGLGLGVVGLPILRCL